MRFNDRRSITETLEGLPELLRLVEVFPVFFSNCVMVLDIVALEKPKSFAVLVIGGPARTLPKYQIIWIIMGNIQLGSMNNIFTVNVYQHNETWIYIYDKTGFLG